jgi:hypothetical protein
MDEVPVINAVLESVGSVRAEVYTYEELSDEDRALKLALILRRGLSMGVPMIVVIPGLMGVTLTSRMDRPVIEALESSLVIEVRLEYGNTLYLPSRGDVELVGKENSESSYERIEWLLGEASRRGVRVAGVRLLRDNRAIWEYVTGAGLEGVHRRVPVNKISWLVAVLSECTGAGEIQVLRRREKTRHYVYAVGLDESLAGALIGSLSRQAGKTCRPAREVAGVVEAGCKEALGELYGRLTAVTG